MKQIMEYTTEHKHGSEHTMTHTWKNGIGLLVNFTTGIAYSLRNGEPKNDFVIKGMSIETYEEILQKHQDMDNQIEGLWKENN